MLHTVLAYEIVGIASVGSPRRPVTLGRQTDGYIGLGPGRQTDGYISLGLVTCKLYPFQFKTTFFLINNSSHVGKIANQLLPP